MFCFGQPGFTRRSPLVRAVFSIRHDLASGCDVRLRAASPRLAQAPSETEMHPDRIGEDLEREPVMLVAGGIDHASPPTRSTLRPSQGDNTRKPVLIYGREYESVRPFSEALRRSVVAQVNFVAAILVLGHVLAELPIC